MPHVTPALLKSLFEGAAQLFNAKPWTVFREEQAFRIQVDSRVRVAGLNSDVVAPGAVWVCMLGHSALAAAEREEREAAAAGAGAGAGSGGSDADGDDADSKPSSFPMRGLCMFFTRYEAEQRMLSTSDALCDEPLKAVGNELDMVCAGCGTVRAAAGTCAACVDAMLSCVGDVIATCRLSVVATCWRSCCEAPHRAEALLALQSGVLLQSGVSEGALAAAQGGAWCGVVSADRDVSRPHKRDSLWQACVAMPPHTKGKRFWGNRECTMMFEAATSVTFDDHDAIDECV